MVNVTGDGNCTYLSVISSLKYARRTQPGCFKGTNYLRYFVANEKDVALSIQKLRNLITQHGASYLQVKRGCSRDSAYLIVDSGLRERAEGNNYAGTMAIDCLAHELNFCAVIHNEIGGRNEHLRMNESGIPLIHLVCLNLVAGSKDKHKPVCSHPTQATTA